MANINQGAPGSVDKSGAQKEQISESTNDVDGRQTRVVLYSDGSRQIWINGVLDHDVPVFSDVEKAAAPVVEAPSEPVANPDAISVPTEAELAAIAEKAAEAAADLEAQAKAAEEAAAVEAAKLEAEAAAEAAKDVPVVEGFIAKTEQKLDDVVNEVVAKVEGLEFKTVAELKALAADLGIDLGNATKKEDILAKVAPATE